MTVVAIGSAPNISDIHVVPSASTDLIATRDLALSGLTTIFPSAGGVLVVDPDGRTVYRGDADYNIDLFSPQVDIATLSTIRHVRTLSSRVTDPYFTTIESTLNHMFSITKDLTIARCSSTQTNVLPATYPSRERIPSSSSTTTWRPVPDRSMYKWSRVCAPMRALPVPETLNLIATVYSHIFPPHATIADVVWHLQQTFSCLSLRDLCNLADGAMLHFPVTSYQLKRHYRQDIAYMKGVITRTRLRDSAKVERQAQHRRDRLTPTTTPTPPLPAAEDDLDMVTYWEPLPTPTSTVTREDIGKAVSTDRLSHGYTTGISGTKGLHVYADKASNYLMIVPGSTQTAADLASHELKVIARYRLYGHNLRLIRQDSLSASLASTHIDPIVATGTALQWKPPHVHQGLDETFCRILKFAIVIAFARAPYMPHQLLVFAAFREVISLNLRPSTIPPADGHYNWTRTECFTGLRPDWLLMPIAPFGKPFLVLKDKTQLSWPFDERGVEAVYLCPAEHSKDAHYFYVPKTRRIVARRSYHALDEVPSELFKTRPTKALNNIWESADDDRQYAGHLFDGANVWLDSVTPPVDPAPLIDRSISNRALPAATRSNVAEGGNPFRAIGAIGKVDYPLRAISTTLDTDYPLTAIDDVTTADYPLRAISTTPYTDYPLSLGFISSDETADLPGTTHVFVDPSIYYAKAVYSASDYTDDDDCDTIYSDVDYIATVTHDGTVLETYPSELVPGTVYAPHCSGEFVNAVTSATNVAFLTQPDYTLFESLKSEENGVHPPATSLTLTAPTILSSMDLGTTLWVLVKTLPQVADQVNPVSSPSVFYSVHGQGTGGSATSSLQSASSIAEPTFLSNTTPVSYYEKECRAEEGKTSLQSADRRHTSTSPLLSTGLSTPSTVCRLLSPPLDCSGFTPKNHQVHIIRQVLKAIRMVKPDYDDSPKLATALAGSDCAAWEVAIESEFTQLLDEGTYEFVNALPKGARWIPSHLVLKYKRNADGSINKLKARLVAGGHRQTFDTYGNVTSPTVKACTVKLLLDICAKTGRCCRAFDVKGAYLKGHIDTELYMRLPNTGKHPNAWVRLIKSLYGLKQAGKIWYDLLSKTLLSIGFRVSLADPCLFIRDATLGQDDSVQLAVHVDDMLIASSSDATIYAVVAQLIAVWGEVNEVKDGTHLGLQLTHLEDGSIRVSQPGYIKKILTELKVLDLTPKDTPLPVVPAVTTDDTLIPQTQYLKALGLLNHAAIHSRPDILFSCSYLATFSSAPTVHAYSLALHVARYLMSNPDLGITFSACGPVQLYAYIDASYNCHRDGKGQTGICFTLGLESAAFYSFSRKQQLVSHASTEAEFQAVDSSVLEIEWLRYLLEDLGYRQYGPTVVFQDNMSTIHLAVNGYTPRTKHYVMRYYYVREAIPNGTIELQYLKTTEHTADILTKSPTNRRLFFYLRSKLMNCVDSRTGF